MSDILLNKSEKNSDAATLLHGEELFCSSVHCSYYSCYQLMIHIIYNVLGYDEEEYSNTNELNNVGSHNYTINIIRQEIISKNNSLTREFADNIRILKDFRKKADYKQVKILKADSNLVIQKSNSFKTILNNTFLL